MPFFLLLFGLLAQAPMARADCLDAKVLAEIRQVMEVQTLPFDLCDSQRQAHKLFSALAFLKTTPLPALNSPLSKNLLPENAWTFLATRVQKFVNEPTCAQGQMAFVRATDPGIAHICPSFYDDDFSLVERLPVLLHEAHHFDGNNFEHANCEQGRLKGMRNACDESLEYGGGYAVELEVLLKLSQAKTLSPALRGRAKTLALGEAAEKFNRSLTSYKLETIYLEGNDGKGYLLDPSLEKVTEVPLLDRLSQDIVSRGTALHAFPRDGRDAYAINALSPSFGALPAQGEVTLNFNRLPKDARPRMLAILNDDTFSGAVTSRSLSVAFGDNPYETAVDFPLPASAVYTGAELGFADRDTVYLQTENQSLLPVKFSAGRNSEILKSIAFPSGFRSFVFVQGQRLGLSDSGILEKQIDGVWQPIAGLKNERFNFASRPFYWAPFLFAQE